MPRNDDILDQFAGAPFIFNLDLTQGLPSFSGSQIASPHGISDLFWPVSIYGPPIWTSEFIQYIYETYARDAQGCETFAQAYIDDMYVFFSHSWDDHIKHLDTILERIQNVGLTVKPKKCSWVDLRLNILVVSLVVGLYSLKMTKYKQ